MRAITLIFAVYVLGMTVMPCEHGIDDFFSEHVSGTHTEDHSHKHSHNQDPEEKGCTPFCICQCCGTSTTIPLSFSFTNTVAPALYAVVHYPSLYSFEYAGGVWHPPSLS